MDDKLEEAQTQANYILNQDDGWNEYNPYNRAASFLAKFVINYEKNMPIAKPIPCGHSCVLGRAQGMSTNGGCHCLEGLKVHERLKVIQALYYYREERKLVVKILRAIRDELKKPDTTKALEILTTYLEQSDAAKENKEKG